MLEVFNNLFMSVAEQMGHSLRNTSMSVNIKERLDFSCAVFDQHGALVANAPHVPVHLGSMAESVRVVAEEIGHEIGLVAGRTEEEENADGHADGPYGRDDRVFPLVTSQAHVSERAPQHHEDSASDQCSAAHGVVSVGIAGSGMSDTAAQIDVDQDVDQHVAAGFRCLDRFEHRQALEYFGAALSASPSNRDAVLGYNLVIQRVVPRWHFAMLNDRQRNDAYDAAIREAAL